MVKSKIFNGCDVKRDGSLNKIRILSIGKNFSHPAVKNTMYKSNISLLGYDIIILDPNSAISEYNGITYYEDPLYSNLNIGSEIGKFLADINRRKTEMLKIIEYGGSILIFTPEPQRFGSNGEHDLSEIIPIYNLHTVEAAGNSIEFVGKEPFNKFWVANKDYLAHRAYFKECNEGDPLFYIKNTKELIGVHFRKEKGNVIFIPNFLDKAVNKKEKNEITNNFIDSIIGLVSELNRGTYELELPNWCSNYPLPEEDTNRDKLKRLHSELKELKLKISNQEKLLVELERHKILFAGDGRALELEVFKIFCNLGFEVKEGPIGRDDLILKYHDKIAVVEVKGVTKSAAQSHARQLEQWVSDYSLKNQIDPKGILIVNAYKNISLKERKEKPFPDQMVPFSEQREHCLLTGLQLLGLYLNCRNNIPKRDEMVNLLFNTNGIFKEYNDWSKFLEIKNIAKRNKK